MSINAISITYDRATPHLQGEGCWGPSVAQKGGNLLRLCIKVQAECITANAWKTHDEH